VDDDGASREATSELLASMGYQVKQAASAEDAMQMLASVQPDVLLTDIALPGMSGIELARAACEPHASIRIVFCIRLGSAFARGAGIQFRVASQAIYSGATACADHGAS
jgi:CheY-like chemotaxis protein